MPGDQMASRRAAPRGVRLPRIRPRSLRDIDWRGTPGRWLAIFAAVFGAFMVRFLVPVPVGQADNRDGPRVMCGWPLHMQPVFPRQDPRYFRFAYFRYAVNPDCHGRLPYPTSELGPLLAARVLTPVFGMTGPLSLIALGILLCALASVAIATLVTGLRIRLWAQVLLAAALWVIVADAAFFDVFASPFEEPAMIIGLLLVVAGLVYLGRDSARATTVGLVLCFAGGGLAILSKEQYLILAVPICPAIVLASVRRRRTRDGESGESWWRRFRSRQVAAAGAVAVVLALMAGAYAAWDASSHYGQRLHHIQATDTIFVDIVTGHDNVHADLRALGLPQSWAKYAGRYYWARGSVRKSPLWNKYLPELTDTNIAKFELTHPGRLLSIGQKSAVQAQLLRVTQLGTYPPDSGHRKGAYESRVTVVTWLMGKLPRNLGLRGLVPLWLAMVLVSVVALRRRRALPWHRDGATVVLCMVGCAFVAFIPPGFFEGISTTRHMVGMNLATLLAIPVSFGLAMSLIFQALRAPRRPQPATAAESPTPELAEPAR